MLRIHEIKLNIEDGIEVMPQRILKRLGIKGLEISDFQLIKESIDARNKSEIKRVYSVDFVPYLPDIEMDVLEKQLIDRCKSCKLEKSPDMSYQPVVEGQEQLNHRPVIVGFGPCGMFAGLILSERGYKPIIIERGKAIEERIRDVDNFWQNATLDEESNVQFGEGGAGLFSDGKLTTQIKDMRVRKVLEEFVEAGGSQELLYKQKPHIGTDVLRSIVVLIRKKIIENGGEILFQSKMSGLGLFGENDERKLQRIIINNDRIIETDNLVLAIGHSARDTLRVLNECGVAISKKPFSIGVRIEHPQAMINEAQYGKQWRSLDLGAAEYKLSHHCKNGRGVYTFCMCPGGFVIGAASQKGCVVTNGMSYHDRGSSLANSGLLVDVRIEDFPDSTPLAGVEFQEKYEKLAFQAGGGNYNAPVQSLESFLNDDPSVQIAEPTYRPGVTWTNLTDCLPDFAVDAMREAIPEFAKKLKGFDLESAILTGVETRSSSPVRIQRNEKLMGNIEGLYPAGEGAGYAGGIISAAVDGIKAAEEIIKKYRSYK